MICFMLYWIPIVLIAGCIIAFVFERVDMIIVGGPHRADAELEQGLDDAFTTFEREITDLLNRKLK